MNQRGSFYRKIAYLIVIAVLLLPISRLGAPSTLRDEGGTLAQLRAKYDLGQADLGEIDPASETIRFATLGMRGIAVSLLWNKANQYKKTEDWTNFRATLRQLAKLQPYFISFWRYQAWNLTYNVSVELDAVQDRYHYVIKGIEFLKEGTRYNRDNPTLLAELGWFTGNKIGRADEHVQYRRLFKADNDFHPTDRPPEQRDNWLVSKSWYEKAISAVDDKKRSLGNKNPTTFYAAVPMAQINYGEAIENEGTFGEKARAAWELAGRLWDRYSHRDLRSSRGFMIRLAEQEKWAQDLAKLEQRLQELEPGIREKLIEERRKKLSPEQLAALKKVSGEGTPAKQTENDEQTEKELTLARNAEEVLKVSNQDIVERIVRDFPDQATEARKLGTRISEANDRLRMIRNDRQVVNYKYWKTRCEFEQENTALKAHELAFAAHRAFQDDADLLQSRQLFEESFNLWAKVLAAHPELPDDSPTGSSIMETVDEYALVLEQLDLSLADPQVEKTFPLWNIVEANDMESKYAGAIEAHQNRHKPPQKEKLSKGNESGDKTNERKSEDQKREAGATP